MPFGAVDAGVNVVVGSSGLSAASMLSELPAAKGPVWRSLVTTAVGEPKAAMVWDRYGQLKPDGPCDWREAATRVC